MGPVSLSWWVGAAMERQKRFDKTLMATAEIWAELSSATKRKVGAVLAKDNRVLVTAYNGTPNGLDNNCEMLSIPMLLEGINKLVTKPEVVHAEQNLIAFAAKNGIAMEGATVYITLSPCMECSKLLIQTGIERLVYKEEWENSTEGLRLLKTAGVIVEQLGEGAL